jgi:hypothetical protein
MWQNAMRVLKVKYFASKVEAAILAVLPAFFIAFPRLAIFF